MKLLRPKSKRETYKWIGAHFPLSIFNYLTMYTVAKGITKTDVLKPLIETWEKEQKEKFDEQTLILEIIEQIQNKCKVESLTNRNFNMTQFKKEISDELLEKGISTYFVTKIIKNL